MVDTTEPLEVVAGLDCAAAGDDYLVFMVGAVYADRVRIAAQYRRQKVTMAVALDTIAAMVRKYRIDRIVVETTGGVGELYREEIERRPVIEAVAIGVSTTATSKPLAIERLTLFLERQLIDVPPQNTIVAEELHEFQRNGKKLEAAKGSHDDTVMALAFLISVVDLEPLEQLDREPRAATATPPPRQFATRPSTVGRRTGSPRLSGGRTRWRNR